MNMKLAFVVVIAACAAAGSVAAAQQVVVESARKIPVAYNVDVVVVGGSAHAVAAATAAAGKGATVFLAAPRTYLGEDMCGTLRLWLDANETPDTALGRRLFAAKLARAPVVPKGAAFSYETDIPSAAKHKDTRPPSMLHDGRHHAAPTQSVQYDGSVTVTADLGRSRKLKSVHVLVYQRRADFEVKEVDVSISADKKTWQPAGTAANKMLNKGGFEEFCIDLALPVTGEARHVRLAVKKTDRVERVLLGEIVIETAEKDAPPPRPKPARPVPRITTPMHVKATLDEALLKAGVKFLYGCFATDVLRDAAGKGCGIVMANRAGRQAVVAKVIIDATDRAWVARMAGAEFQPFKPGRYEFRQVVIGGEVKAAENVTGRKIGRSYGVVARSRDGRTGRPTGSSADLIEYTLTLDMPDATFASFAAADQVARDMTFHPGQYRVSEDLFQVPPDPMKSVKPLTGDWDVAAADLKAFQPANVTRMYVLGGCADVSRPAAGRLLKPTGLIALGERIGAAAAAEAKALPAPAGVKLPGAAAAGAVGGEVREFLTGVRSTQQLATIPAESRPLAVLARYDVVVIGGGTGGAPAGIAAGRHGARTLVVEFLHGLGGVGTQGLIGSYYHGYRGGFTAEVDKGVAAASGTRRGRRGWNVEAKMQYWRSEIRKAGGDVWFGCVGCGALVDRGRIRGAVVATPAGRGVVLADVVIDGTGNADVAAAAGAPFIHTGGDFLSVQGTGLPPRALGASYTNTDYTFVDDADMVDIWRLFVSARQKYRSAFDLGQLIDTRERRRIKGEVVVTILDQMNDRTYRDTIGMCKSDFDMHGFPVHPFFVLSHPQRKSLTTYIPYRCLLPAKLEGILVIGLGISVHRDALPGTRMQPDIQNIGYAAGTAAAMAAKSGGMTREIDIRALQKHLAEIGNIPASAVAAKESYPMPDERIAEAVRSLASDYRGTAVVLAHREKAVSMLEEAYRRAADEKARRIYAHVLAVCGSSSGVDTLIAAVKAAEKWDRGWNFKGMGQYGWALSPLDRWIVALGMAGEKRAMLQPAAGSNRSLPLREIIIARALYRLGDHKGRARRSLERFAQDVRGHFARHASAILQAGRK